MAKNQVTQEFAKRRKKNIMLLVGLLLFALALWGMTFFVRLNYIKGLSD